MYGLNIFSLYFLDCRRFVRCRGDLWLGVNYLWGKEECRVCLDIWCLIKGRMLGYCLNCCVIDIDILNIMCIC